MPNTATLSSKFQIAIPKAVRDSQGIQAGQKFVVIPKDDGIMLVPVPSVDDLVGIARGANTAEIRDRDDRF
ncbi:MAG: AbrB/MazE/SpoVT family DNA-binding domain-containing protein [Pseudomonadota bacterium]